MCLFDPAASPSSTGTAQLGKKRSCVLRLDYDEHEVRTLKHMVVEGWVRTDVVSHSCPTFCLAPTPQLLVRSLFGSPDVAPFVTRDNLDEDVERVQARIQRRARRQEHSGNGHGEASAAKRRRRDTRGTEAGNAGSRGGSDDDEDAVHGGEVSDDTSVSSMGSVHKEDGSHEGSSRG